MRWAMPATATRWPLGPHPSPITGITAADHRNIWAPIWNSIAAPAVMTEFRSARSARFAYFEEGAIGSSRSLQGATDVHTSSGYGRLVSPTAYPLPSFERRLQERVRALIPDDETVLAAVVVISGPRPGIEGLLAPIGGAFASILNVGRKFRPSP